MCTRTKNDGKPHEITPRFKVFLSDGWGCSIAVSLQFKFLFVLELSGTVLPCLTDFSRSGFCFEELQIFLCIVHSACEFQLRHVLGRLKSRSVCIHHQKDEMFF